MKLGANLPGAIRGDVERAIRLEWWNIGWSISIIVVMGLAMGSSQAMKTAWVEDTLGLIPPIVFLIAVHFEAREATEDFPFGFQRVHSLAFLIAAGALLAVGALLLKDSVATLLAGEHATVATITLFGHSFWLGWLMLAAQFYSMIPPFIIGRREMPLARRLQDEVLFTDAKMNKANWLTGAAGIAGVMGLGLGYWWADAAAAAVISGSIILDGVHALRIATAELVDGRPRALGGTECDPEAERLMEKLAAQYADAEIRLRETGRYIRVEVCGIVPDQRQDLESLWPGEPERSWRLAEVSFVPPDEEPADQERRRQANEEAGAEGRAR